MNPKPSTLSSEHKIEYLRKCMQHAFYCACQLINELIQLIPVLMKIIAGSRICASACSARFQCCAETGGGGLQNALFELCGDAYI
jgi:hypothetical protein